MVWVRFESFAEKLKVIRGKIKLWEKREWITENLTKKKRRIEWLTR